MITLLEDVLAGRRGPQDLDAGDWNRLLLEGRSANMVSRLGSVLEQQANPAQWPQAVRDVIAGSNAWVAYMQMRARHELDLLGQIASDCAYPVVLLKGAAYVLADSVAAKGRSLSDLDVLVPRSELADFEARLQRAGWRFAETLDDYDDFYYRELSHELPPMRHSRCQLELDVHHNVLQPTHRLKVDAARLLEAATPVAGTPFHALDLRDQILHSATHLTMSDELRGGLRDMHDIKLLLEDGARRDGAFPGRLVERSFDLGLQRPLYYALEYLQARLGCVLPPDVEASIRAAAPAFPVRPVMTKLVEGRLTPAIGAPLASQVNETLLFLRSHWIRMPPLMLTGHLLRKAVTGRDAGAGEPREAG